MLSGFYLSLNTRNESPIPFYRRTLKFLIVPYVTYSLAYSILKLREGLSLWLLTKNLLTASASAHLWFGLLVIQLYVLHPFVSRLYRRHRSRELVVVAAFVVQIAWSVFVSLVLGESDPLRTDASTTARLAGLLFASHIGYFVAGYYLLERSTEAAHFLRNAGFLCAAGAVWAASAAVIALNWGVGRAQGDSFAESLGSCVMIGVSLPLMSLAAFATIVAAAQELMSLAANRLRNFLHSLGLYSYGIYYLHGFAIWLVSWVLRRAIHLSRTDAAFYLLMFLLTPLLTLWCVRFLAKLPFGKYVT